MGHERIGYLTKSKKWRTIVYEVANFTANGETIAQIINQTTKNVLNRYDNIESDKGVMAGVNTSKGVFIYGDIPDKSANKLIYIPMINMGNNIFQYSTQLLNGTSGAFIFANDPNGATKETVPSECRKYWNQYRGYTVSLTDKSCNFKYIWGKCENPATGLQDIIREMEIFCFPNPASDILTIDLKDIKGAMIQVFNLNGEKVFQIMPKYENQFVVNAKETARACF